MRSPDGTFSTITTPDGCVATYPLTMNSTGTIVGYCSDSNTVFHGFTRTPDGTTAVYSAPGAGNMQYTGTGPTSITPNGRSVGYFVDDSGVYHGYRLNPPAN